MPFADLNILAIVAAASVSFVFGGIWYGIFSRAWMKAVRINVDELKAARAAVAPYAITFFAQLIMASVLSLMLGRLGASQFTLANGLMTGAVCWLGFVATSLVVNHAFQMQRPQLTVIDGGHWLGVLLAQGAVIGWFGV